MKWIVICLLAVILSGCSGREPMQTDFSGQADAWSAVPEAASEESMGDAAKNACSASESITKLSWKVIDYGGPPYFHLYVIVNDEEEYYAGYFYGENFETGEWVDTPDNALTAAGAIWTGIGELFYIYQKNETELALMNHHAPYGAGPKEWEDYQEIITIPVEKGSRIEVGEVVHVKKQFGWSQSYNFIIFDSFLLGGLEDGNLIPLSDGNLKEYSNTAVSTEWGFRLFKDGRYLDTVSYEGFDDQWLHDIVTEGIDSHNIGRMLVDLKYAGERFDGLAVNNGYPLTFGPNIQLDSSASVYVDYIADILAENGLEDEPVHIREIVRTDLEGDGVDEVFITASNIDIPGKQKGQYSIAVLRKIIDGEVTSIFLTKEIRNVLPDEGWNRLIFDYELLEIVDLDYDGVCELLIAETYYEGRYYLVYKLINGELQLVLEGGFGV